MKTFSSHVDSDGIIKNIVLLFTELKYLPLMGKLDDKRSVLLSNSRIIASLRRHDVHICSAALLSNQHALTTAICLKGLLNETGIPRFDQFTLVAGRYDIDNGTTVFKIGQVQVHKRFMFSAPNALHNVGLITVNYQHFLKFHIFDWKSFSISETPLKSGYFQIKINLHFLNY